MRKNSYEKKTRAHSVNRMPERTHFFCVSMHTYLQTVQCILFLLTFVSICERPCSCTCRRCPSALRGRTSSRSGMVACWDSLCTTACREKREGGGGVSFRCLSASVDDWLDRISPLKMCRTVSTKKKKKLPFAGSLCTFLPNYAKALPCLSHLLLYNSSTFLYHACETGP